MSLPQGHGENLNGNVCETFSADNWLRGVDYGCHPEYPDKICPAPPPTINEYTYLKRKSSECSESSQQKRGCSLALRDDATISNTLEMENSLDDGGMHSEHHLLKKVPTLKLHKINVDSNDSPQSTGGGGVI